MASDVDTGRNIATGIGVLLLLLAHAGIEAGRGWLAADARLRSALKAWWRGMALLCKRPLAVLGAYLLPTLCSLLAALLLLVLRQHLQGAGFAGFVLAMLLGCMICAAIAWGKNRTAIRFPGIGRGCPRPPLTGTTQEQAPDTRWRLPNRWLFAVMRRQSIREQGRGHF